MRFSWPRPRALVRVAAVQGFRAAAFALLLAHPQPARADAVFRPVVADPRENLARWRVVSAQGDWRYGTDVTDSTSVGGWVEDRKTLPWEIAAGHTFRWRPLRRVFGLAPPWSAYQLGVPAGVFALFDNSGSLLNTDYQFGLTVDVQWNGDDLVAATPDDAATDAGFFDRPVVTSRLKMFHRSSHLGDEYLALSRFGRNQNGHPIAGALFDHPPVKRVDLTYEAIEGLVAVEWSPPFNQRRSVARLVAGADAKLVFADVGALTPRNFRSPAFRAGMEWWSSGNQADPHDGWLTRSFNALARDAVMESAWFGAFDVRVARPYNFASGDNPDGEDEAWTPRAWTETPYGREFRHYAGSWHAMVGAALWPRRDRPARTPLAGRMYLLSLEWYRGYSPNGQFLDQREAWHPRWYVVPSVTARF